MKNPLPLAFAFLIMSACAVGPDYERPAFYSDAAVADSLGISERGMRPVDTNWYESFGDDTLNTLVHEAITRNLDVKTAVWSLRQVRERLTVLKSPFFPMIDAQGAYTRTHASENNPVSFREDYFTVGLDASWELDLWGGTRRRVEAGNALARAAAQELQNVLISLKAEVVNVYFQLRITQEERYLLEKNIDLQRGILAIVKKKNDSGLTSPADVNRTQYALETLTSQIPALKLREEICLNALAVLTARLPDDSAVLKEISTEKPAFSDVVFDFTGLSSVPVSVLHHRPDVRIAEENLIAENALTGAAIAQLFPNVGVTAFFGYEAEAFKRLADSDSKTASVQPSATLPILHWGALWGAVKEQKSATKQAALTYQNTLLSAIADIKNAIASLYAAHEQIVPVEESVRQMQTVVFINIIQYQEGLVSLSDLLTQTQDLIAAQTTFLSTKLTIYKGISAFYKAIGI